MRWTITGALTASILSVGSLAACGSDPVGPVGSTTFATALNLTQLDSALGAGRARLEIKLLPGGLEAREIEIEPDDAEEKIVGRATAIDPGTGTITLDLGGLTIRYGAGTRFRTPTDSRVARAAWEAEVARALGAGGEPLIEARRNRPAVPQDPADPSFTASDLRLGPGVAESALEFYVDRDNFEHVVTPPPNAILRVLNLPIAITDNTELRRRHPGGSVPTGAVEFEGGVTSVNVTTGTLTLTGGTVVDAGGVTFDPLGDLLSLQATADAVADGKAVRAEGRGTVTSAGPPVLVQASVLKVEVDN
jgi:hypothetical protein